MRTGYQNETNGLVNGQEYHEQRRGAPTVYWNTPGLKITRLRLLTDPGIPFYDISYCDGELADGQLVNVRLPFHQLPRKGMVREIIEYAKHDKVYAKGLGILDHVSALW